MFAVYPAFGTAFSCANEATISRAVAYSVDATHRFAYRATAESSHVAAIV
jgi:hypothetical protein